MSTSTRYMVEYEYNMHKVRTFRVFLIFFCFFVAVVVVVAAVAMVLFQQNYTYITYKSGGGAAWQPRTFGSAWLWYWLSENPMQQGNTTKKIQQQQQQPTNQPTKKTREKKRKNFRSHINDMLCCCNGMLFMRLYDIRSLKLVLEYNFAE